MNQMVTFKNPLEDLDFIRELSNKFSKEMFLECLNSTDNRVRVAAASRPDFIPDSSMIDSILMTNDSMLIRTCLMKNTVKLEPHHVDLALDNEDLYVRATIFHRHDIKLTKEQLDMGAKDSEKVVREMCIKRHDFLVTPELLEFYERKYYLDVLVLALHKDNFTLNEKQANAFLNHDLYPIRIATAKRKDLVINEERIAKGLSSTIQVEREHWMHLKNQFDANNLANELSESEKLPEQNASKHLTRMLN